MQYSLDDLRAIAKEHNYNEIDHQENIYMVSFGNGNVRINIYYSKGTIATCINHPKKGKTQLFRKHTTLAELKKLFTNPRTHTGKGYYTK